MYPIIHVYIFMYPIIFTRFDPAMASEHMDETSVSILEENLEFQALSDVVKHIGEHSINEQLLLRFKPSNPNFETRLIVRGNNILPHLTEHARSELKKLIQFSKPSTQCHFDS